MKKSVFWVIGVLVIAAGAYALLGRGGDEKGEIEYRYEKVEKGELVRSISATGVLVAYTQVDVKSKAGGKVVRLAVDEGTFVRRGDLIALIDPEDTRATVEQSAADLQAARARAAQAASTYRLQTSSSETAVAEAQAALDSARIRLRRVELETVRTPALSRSQLDTARASLREAETAKRRLAEVTLPARQREAQGNYDRAKAELDAARADFERQNNLLQLGYVAQSVVDRARSQLQAAQSAYNLAEQNLKSIGEEVETSVRSADAAIARAQAAVRQAEANLTADPIARENLAEARQAVRTAEINLRRAIDQRIQNDVRRSEVQAAQASTVRSRVSLQNAQVQLNSTTVVAPRDGVVTMKYLEEGTIIPPGTSTFSQGTSIVQISDVTRMYVDCAVDEADVAQVTVGQKARVMLEAYPGQRVEGVVERVNPAATTENNVTAVKVRVRILPGSDKSIRLLPGLNATCEFITLSKPDVLIAPSQAIRNEDGKTTVRIKGRDPKKPETREVKVGQSGNEGVEVLEGLKEGEEVVTAEIDLAEAREIQRRMQEAQQGGGLAGGGQRGGPRGGSRAGMGGGGGGGGGRPGGGGGGGR